ncbi:MAG: O-antigen ligase family protein, partial [Terriglobales bacterium]
VTHGWVPNQSHNGYIEMYANLGWIGVMLLALIIIVGYLHVIKAWRRSAPASDLALAYIVAVVISNMTEASLFRMLIPAWLFFLLAVTVPYSVPARTHNTDADSAEEFDSVPQLTSS